MNLTPQFLDQHHPLKLIYQDRVPVHQSIGGFPAVSIPVTSTQIKEYIIEIEGYARQGKKFIETRLMDSSEPLFYYVFLLDENSFYSLSKTQNILVGFDSFPTKLVEFFELSKNSQSRFMSVWSTSSEDAKEGQLNIIETNSFKQIVHVSLPFVLASDEHMKRHLASINQSYREELRGLKSKYEEMERAKITLEHDREKYRTELERSRLTSSEQLQQLRQQYAPELLSLSSTCSPLAQALDDLSLQYEREKKQIESQYQDKLKNLTEKCSLLESQQNVLTVLKRNLESSLSDLTIRFTETQNEMFKYKAELFKFKDSDHVIPEMEREMIRLRERIRDSELEKSNQEDQIKRKSFEMKSFQDQQSKLEELLQQLRQQQQQTDHAYQQATSELHRQADTIERLQQELRSVKSKHKSKTHQLEEKDALAQLQQSQLESLKKELDGMRDVLNNKEQQISKINRDLEQSQILIKELKEKSESNEKVIEWFYKTNTGVPPTLSKPQHSAKPNASSYTQLPKIGMAYQPKKFPTSFVYPQETPLRHIGIVGDAIVLGSSISPPESIPSPPEPTILQLNTSSSSVASMEAATIV